MVVRFEVDAYVEPPRPPLPPSQVSQSSPRSSSRSRNRRRYSQAKLSASATQPPIGSAHNPSQSTQLVNVTYGGTSIPQSSILEIKTCLLSKMSSKKSDSYPQLFFSQTPHLYIAGHTNGLFSDIKKNAVSQGDLEIQHDALMNSGVLKRLVVALRRIQERVRREGKRGRLTLIYEAKTLRIYQRSAGSRGSLLPEDIIARFQVGS